MPEGPFGADASLCTCRRPGSYRRMSLCWTTRSVGFIMAVAAASAGTAAASPAPQRVLQLPAKLWVVAPSPAMASTFTAAQAVTLRANGINAIVAERGPLTDTQIAVLRRGATRAKLLVFVAYPVSRRPRSCAGASAPLCVPETTIPLTAAKLARGSKLPVVLRVSDIGQVSRLGRVARGRVNDLSPLSVTKIDANQWQTAA